MDTRSLSLRSALIEGDEAVGATIEVRPSVQTRKGPKSGLAKHVKMGILENVFIPVYANTALPILSG